MAVWKLSKRPSNVVVAAFVPLLQSGERFGVVNKESGICKRYLVERCMFIEELSAKFRRPEICNGSALDDFVGVHLDEFRIQIMYANLCDEFECTTVSDEAL